jgi:hypothetical protein
MKNLVVNLKENLILRRKKEVSRMLEMKKDSERDLLLIASGRVSELDFMIESLDDLLAYFEKTNKTLK